MDIDPISEGHTLIVPKRHILDIEEADQGLRLGIINASALISAALKLLYTPDGISMMQNGGYFNDVNHYHMHVFARYKKDGFSWIDPANPKSSGLSKNEIANQLKETIIHIPRLALYHYEMKATDLKKESSMFTGKKAIVTGANQSIGQSIAVALAEQGADVVISYRSDKVGAEKTLAAMLQAGCKATMIYADFSENSNVAALFDQAYQFLQGVDLLVNNAGMLARETTFEIDPVKMSRVFQVNTIAPFYLAQLCAQRMIENKVTGSIVNISSIAGTFTAPRGIAYASSKAALNKWTQNMALNTAIHGIRVNAVAPGVIEAGMNATTAETNPQLWQENLKQIPLQRAGSPEDISKMVLYLLSENANWITGKIYEVDGGHVL